MFYFNFTSYAGVVIIDIGFRAVILFLTIIVYQLEELIRYFRRHRDSFMQTIANPDCVSKEEITQKIRDLSDIRAAIELKGARSRDIVQEVEEREGEQTPALVHLCEEVRK